MTYKIYWLYTKHCEQAHAVREATREGRIVWICRHDTQKDEEDLHGSWDDLPNGFS